MSVLRCFMGGQLVFDWYQLGKLLITRERPVGNKVTNTLSHAKVKYHMCRYSAPSPLIHRQKVKSLWSVTAIGTKDYALPTNFWIIFM